MDKWIWAIYALAAGLAWGTYVPLIFYGGNELGGKPGSRLMAILCVGVAYFVIAVLLPLALFATGQAEWPDLTGTGLTFSGLAGAAGAVGAIFVIFASKAAVEAARDSGLPPFTFRMYIAPLIFGLAPVINTLVSLVWHPKKGEPFHFALHLPETKSLICLVVGILLVGGGAALVLYSKELAETAPHKPAAAAPRGLPRG
jgi:hypothetical protein